MATRAELVVRYRLAAVAVALSAGLHAAVLVGLPERIPAIDDRVEAIYSATLEPIATVMKAAPPPAPATPAPAKRPPRAKPKAVARAPAPVPAVEAPPEAAADTVPEIAPEAVAAAEPVAIPEPEPQAAPPEPEKVALAEPVAPPAPAQPEPFPVEALPANVSISYKLTSAFADGRAEYRWNREGDHYQIDGEAEAEGFFTLFLEGRVLQAASGSVTSHGLRPDRFSEQRPNASPEGVEFDWNGKQVTQERGEKKTVTALNDNTVDWLSMIFQMAHVPPKTEGPIDLKVFTQRKLYRFQLEVVGVEEIDIPLGKVRAVHLRHIDAKDASEVVDVWLGVDQYHLPVKLRYPVARNRLMVEQLATSVSAK